MSIVRDEAILGGEPRIDGTRIAVRHVASRAISGDQSPAVIADQLDLPLAAVYEALSYYYEHVEEIKRFERANEAAMERVRDEGLGPKEPVE